MKMTSDEKLWKEHAGFTADCSKRIILNLMRLAREDEQKKRFDAVNERFEKLHARNMAGSEMDERWCRHKKDICNR